MQALSQLRESLRSRCRLTEHDAIHFQKAGEEAEIVRNECAKDEAVACVVIQCLPVGRRARIEPNDCEFTLQSDECFELLASADCNRKVVALRIHFQKRPTEPDLCSVLC